MILIKKNSKKMGINNMAITFTDEDMMYLDKEQDTQLRSIRQGIDA